MKTDSQNKMVTPSTGKLSTSLTSGEPSLGTVETESTAQGFLANAVKAAPHPSRPPTVKKNGTLGSPSGRLLNVDDMNSTGASYYPVRTTQWSLKKAKLSSELLKRTFTFLSISDNARNARVSVWWRTAAFALVWQQVDLSNALQVLAPLERKGKLLVCNNLMNAEG